MFDFCPRTFSKQEMDFVESVFNVKQGAIKSLDIYAKVWLGSPFVCFLLISFFFFCLFISFVFKKFNEAENMVM